MIFKDSSRSEAPEFILSPSLRGHRPKQSRHHLAGLLRSLHSLAMTSPGAGLLRYFIPRNDEGGVNEENEVKFFLLFPLLT